MTSEMKTTYKNRLLEEVDLFTIYNTQWHLYLSLTHQTSVHDFQTVKFPLRKRLFTGRVSGYKKYLTGRLSGYKKYLIGRLSGYKKYLTGRLYLDIKVRHRYIFWI